MTEPLFYSKPNYRRNNPGYIVVPIDEEMRQRARDLTDLRIDHYKNNPHSILKGKGIYAGYLGLESVLRAIYGSSYEDTYDFDVIINSFKVEIKTKRRTVEPRSDYECSVAKVNCTQKADYYLFTSLLGKDLFKENESHSQCFILGYMTPENYFKKARFLEKGETDYSSSNGFNPDASCYNNYHRDLEKIEKRFMV